MDSKHTLVTIFSMGLNGERADAPALATRLGVESEVAKKELQDLERTGMIEIDEKSARLTLKGRKRIRVVFIGGGFEIIHPGHVQTIEQAKKLGDVLVVVVARDSTIRMRKGRNPVTSEGDRLHLLSSLRQVDVAILGSQENIYVTLEKVKPDVVALGYDQQHVETDILREGKKRGLDLRVVRLGSNQPKLKTSKILSET